MLGQEGVTLGRTPAAVVLAGGLQKVAFAGLFPWWLVPTEARRVLAIETSLGCM